MVKGADEMIIDLKMDELLELDAISEDNRISFTPEAKKLIHEIATECKKTKIYKVFAKRKSTYGKNETAEELFVEMLRKMAAAPSNLYMYGTIRVSMPLIDNKIRSGKEN